MKISIGIAVALSLAVGWGSADAAQLTLNWVSPSSDALGFTVERSTGTGDFAEIARTGADAFTYSDTTVADGVTYCFRVRAFSASEFSPYTNVACGTGGGESRSSILWRDSTGAVYSWAMNG